MKAQKIAVGGTYEVRYATGVHVKARILREIENPNEMLPTRNPDTDKVETQYEVETTQRVGIHPRGHRFKVKARSVKKLVSLPQDNGNGEPEDDGPEPSPTVTDLRGRGPWGTDLPEDTAVREGNADRDPTQVSVALTLKLSKVGLADIMSIMAILREYDPEILDLAKS